MPKALAVTLLPDYDELADAPVEMADFWSGHFTSKGVPHRVVITGAAPSSWMATRLLADMQGHLRHRNCFLAWPWQSRAHDRYVFLINAVADGYGGLEHRHSTALICKRRRFATCG